MHSLCRNRALRLSLAFCATALLLGTVPASQLLNVQSELSFTLIIAANPGTGMVAACAHPLEGDADCDGLMDPADPCPGETLNRCVGPVAVCGVGVDQDCLSSLPLRLDLGNTAPQIDCRGETWNLDAGNGSDEGGTKNVNPSPIVKALTCTSNATEAIIQSGKAGQLVRRYPLPNGDYVVNLWFAEVNRSSCRVGDRTIDVVIEGERVFGGPGADDGLDIFAESVAQNGEDDACGGLVVRSAVVRVADGVLDVALTEDGSYGSAEALLQAVEVLEIRARGSSPDLETDQLESLDQGGLVDFEVSVEGDGNQLAVACVFDMDCDDGNVCTDETCGAGNLCVYSNNTLPCEDGNACTSADVCSGGGCTGGTQQVLSSDPSLYVNLRMEEPSGTRFDSSPQMDLNAAPNDFNDLSAFNGPGSTTDSREGDFALDLTEGAQQYLQREAASLSPGFPGNPGSANSGLTLAGWVKAKSAGNHALVMKTSDGNRSYSVWIWDFGGSVGTVIDPNIFDSDGNPSSAGDFRGTTEVYDPALTEQDWFHFVYTYDGNTGVSRLYVNGLAEGNTDDPFNPEDGFNEGFAPDKRAFNGANADFEIGRRIGQFANYADVLLDEVLVFDRVLGASEALSLFQDGVTEDDALCDDGVGCTVDSCDPSLGCSQTPDDTLCDNGEFCDGAETCDPISDCQPGTPPVVDDGISALSFDGVDDWVNIPDLSLAGDFTLEAWMLLAPGISNRDGIVAQEGLGQCINFHNARLRLFAPGDVLVANTPTVANTWTHYAISRQGGALTLYINGVPNATGTWSGIFAPKAIGRTDRGTMTQGQMDEVRLWSLARSGAEIAANFDKSVAPASPGLVGYWKFNESAGEQAVIDASGSGNDGSLGGTLAPASDDPARVDSTAPLTESGVCDATCVIDADCNNGEFCDGAETCNMSTGMCQPGTAPVIDDGVGCTDDSCDEVNNVVVNTPNDANCDNGEFCDGAETCDAVNDCQLGTDPCEAGETCNEVAGVCGDCTIDADCDNGDFCDGAETCNVATSACQPGTAPVIDDGVGCTDDSCDEVNNVVVNTPNDANCDNGDFCDGAETCDGVNDCQAGTPPVTDDGVGCTDDSCDEVNNVVVNTPNDANCDNGEFCDGAETCDPISDCQPGTPPVVDDGISALSFDGVNDWVNIPDLSLAGDFTLEAWMLLAPGIDNRDGIVAQEGPGQCINFHNARVRLFAPGDVLVANTPTVANTWTHYAISRQGGALTLYINGVPDATGTWSGIFAPKAIGRTDRGTMTQGQMDEVRLWSLARSGAEIAANFDKSVAPASPGLVGYWKFNESAGEQAVIDASGSGNDGSLGGTLTPASDDPARVDSTAPLTESGVCDATCVIDADCNNGEFCDGAETCNMSTGMCQPGTAPVIDDGVGCTDDSCDEVNNVVVNTPNDANCDNGDFCDGAEACDAVNDCQAGTSPVTDDGVGCTDDSCDEVNNVVVNTPNDANCDNGEFCDGAETCDAVNDCQLGTDPCEAGETCNEVAGVCGDCTIDADCDNGDFCDGAETCNVATSACQPGTAPICDDGNACTEDSCNPTAGCANTVLAADPDLYFYGSLEEPSGTRFDSSPQMDLNAAPNDFNDLSAFNGPGSTTDSREGDFALDLTGGAQQYLQREAASLSPGFPGNPGSANSGLTLAGWVKAKSAGNHALVMKTSDGNRSYSVWIWDFGGSVGTVIDPNIFDSDGNPSSAGDFRGTTKVYDPALTEQDWFHYVYTYDGNTGVSRLYVNGLAEGNTDDPFNPEDGFNEGFAPDKRAFNGANADFEIGRRIGQFANYADVLLDEVLVFDRVLGASEALSLFQDGVQAGNAVCDDGVGCTVDSCDPALGCSQTPDDTLCDNGEFCDGAETCDPISDCQPGTPPVVDDGISALSFDGVNDWVNIPDLSLAGDFTLEAWMLLAPGISNRDGIVAQEGPGQCINFHNARLRLFAPGDVLVANTPTVANTWTHYAITRQGGALTLYINGVPDATGTWSGIFAPKAIGRTDRGTMTQGQMDEVRLWSLARSGAEIAANFDKSVAPASPGLVGYWKFNESAGEQAVIDSSGSGNNGSLGGTLAPAGDDPARVDSTAPLGESGVCGGDI